MSLKTWIAEKAISGKLPLWMYRLAGRLAAKKIGLEDNMDGQTEVTKTPWYKTRTAWIAILGAILGAVQPVSAALGHPVVIPNWIYEILGGMGLYTLRSAVTAEAAKNG